MKITDKRREKLKRLAKRVNDSLYRLEKAGLQLDSKEYQIIQHYAVSKNDKMYNVNTEKGTIRVTTDLSRFSNQDELSRYQEVLNNILDAQTRTVSGTRKAVKKAISSIEEKIKIRPGSINPKDLDYDKYKKIWKIYRNNVDTTKQKVDSDQVFNLITREQGFYDLTEDQISEAFKYFNTYNAETAEDKIYEDYGDLF